MRFNTSLAVAGALGLAVLTAGPALAEPVPSDLTAATATPEAQATETPKVDKKPETKPVPSETAKPKPTKPAESDEAPAVTPVISLSDRTVNPGSKVTVSVVGDVRAGEVIFSSDLFGTKHVLLDDNGRATHTFVVPADANPDTYSVRADLGRFGKPTVGLTVVKAEEAPAIDPAFDLSSYTVKPGGKVTAHVVGDIRAGEVIFSSDLFGTKYVQLTEGKDGKGSASFTFTAPADAKPGSYAVRADLGRFGKPTVGLTVVKAEEAPAIDPVFGLSSYTVKPGGQVTAHVVGDIRAGEVIFSSDLFGTKYVQLTEGKDGKGSASFTFTAPADAKPGSYAVRADLGRFGKPTANLAVVKGVVPATALDLRLEPTHVVAGQSYYAGVTTKNVKPGTVVTFKDPGGKKFYAKLDGYGTARVKLTTPKGTKPGRYTVTASVAGKTDTARLTVVARAEVNMILTPNKVNAGGNFTAYIATRNVAPGTRVTIVDPAGKQFSVKVNKAGVGGKKFHVPSGTKPGNYWFTAKVNGAKDVEKLVVKARWSTQSLAYTPKGGAATGGGIAAEGSSSLAELGGVALGGLLIAGGAGAAFFGRRRAEEV